MLPVSANFSTNLSPRRGLSSGHCTRNNSIFSISCPTLSDNLSMKTFDVSFLNGDRRNKDVYTVLFSHGNAVDIGQVS